MIARWVRPYLMIPFEARGRTRAGCDCWGLTRLILLEQYEIEVPEYLEYDDPGDPAEIGPFVRECMKRESDWSPLPDFSLARAGDALVMRCQGETAHIGIVVDRGLFIHTTPQQGARIEPFLGSRYGSRVIGVYRHRTLSA